MTIQPLESNWSPEPQDEDRDAWLRERKSCIGGSDIAAILGHSPWKSPLALYEEKRSDTTDHSDNERMLWGRLNEDTVAQEVSRRMGCKVRRRNGIIRHKKWPAHGATSDRHFVSAKPRPDWWEDGWERVGLEIKTAGVDQRRGWMENGPPPYYVDQCRWYMHVTGWDAWMLAVLFGGNELREWIIYPDPEWEDAAVKAANDFLTDIALGNPPPPSGQPCDTDIIKTYFPHSIPLSEALYADAVDRWVEQYRTAADDIKRSKTSKERAKQEIMLLIGEHECMTLPDGRGKITLKENKNGNRLLRVP